MYDVGSQKIIKHIPHPCVKKLYVESHLAADFLTHPIHPPYFLKIYWENQEISIPELVFIHFLFCRGNTSEIIFTCTHNQKSPLRYVTSPD
jgi:hypothetical protein